MKAFIINSLSLFNKTRIAIITFGNNAEIILPLSSGMKQSDIAKFFHQLKPVGGEANLVNVLHTANQLVKGLKTAEHQILIFVINQAKILPPTDYLQEKGLKVAAIYLGEIPTIPPGFVNKPSLFIVSKPGHLTDCIGRLEKELRMSLSTFFYFFLLCFYFYLWSQFQS